MNVSQGRGGDRGARLLFLVGVLCAAASLALFVGGSVAVAAGAGAKAMLGTYLASGICAGAGFVATCGNK